MTPKETEQLSRFLGPLRSARVNNLDTDANRLIREAVADNPDASYLLVQRAMLLEQALNAAKGQIAKLQQQLTRGSERDQEGFLGRNNPWGDTDTRREPAGVPGAAGYQTPRAMPAAPAAGMGSSFLGNVATTAAGVVAGSFLYHGIESLLGHQHGAPSGFDSAAAPAADEPAIDKDYSADADDSWSREDPSDEFLAEDDIDTFGDDSFLDGGADDSGWV